jgi:hypothetical protein
VHRAHDAVAGEETGAAVRRAGAQAIIGILGGDENIIKQVQEYKRIQARVC